MRYFTFLALLWVVLACQTDPAAGDPSLASDSDSATASGPSSAPAPAPQGTLRKESGPAPELDVVVDEHYALRPGHHLGRIDSTTTIDQVKGLYGPTNVAETESDIPGGAVVKTLTLFVGQPGEAILFHPARDDEGYVDQAYLVVERPDSPWRITGSGIGIGTDLETVERLNGRPFRLQSAEMEGVGEVTDWNGGRLAGTDYLTFDGPGQIPRTSDPEQFEVLSSDPAVRKANLKVTRMVVFAR